jgi:hypothetical protein
MRRQVLQSPPLCTRARIKRETCRVSTPRQIGGPLLSSGNAATADKEEEEEEEEALLSNEALAKTATRMGRIINDPLALDACEECLGPGHK